MCGRKDPQPVSWQSLLDSGHLLTLQVLTEAKDSFKTKHVLTPHKHTHTHTHTHTRVHIFRVSNMPILSLYLCSSSLLKQDCVIYNVSWVQYLHVMNGF